MAIPTTFDYTNGTNQALIYKYEIYDASGVKISGLLSDDMSSGTSTWDSDGLIGGNSTYDIKFLVDVNTGSTGEQVFLETIDVNFDFNTDSTGVYSLFGNFDNSGISFDTSGSIFNYGLTTTTSDTSGNGDQLRFTGAVGDKLSTNASFSSSDEYQELFTVKGVTLNDTENLSSLLDSSGLGTITMSADTNIYDTTLSARSLDNAVIKSLAELGVTAETNVSSTDKYNSVSLHEAKSDLFDFGTTIYTQRNVGSNEKTFLVRTGDVVKAEAYWTNAGTYSEDIQNLILSDSVTSDLQLVSGAIDASGFYVSSLGSTDSLDDYIDRNDSVNMTDSSGAVDTSGMTLQGFDVSQSDASGLNITTLDGSSNSLSSGIALDLNVKVNAAAGTRIDDLSFYKITGQNQDASGAGQAVDSSKVTQNVVTYAGDLNYDGRVSLKDLAFLNAGKLRSSYSGTTRDDFRDVDANYDGAIDIKDLQVLSLDWNSTIHGTFDASTLEIGIDASGNTGWSSVKASTVNFLANGTDDLDPFTSADLNEDIDFANSSFDYQSGSVETAHSATGIQADLTSILNTDSGV